MNTNDTLIHYGVKGMKWGQHFSNMRRANKMRRMTSKKLNDEEATIGTRYGIEYALGYEHKLESHRRKSFMELAKKKANNDISVKKQKLIDKYSINDSTTGLTSKGEKKYHKLKQKSRKLENKHYKDIEFGYNVNKRR